MLEGIYDGKCLEAASLKKMPDEPNIYTPMKFEKRKALRAQEVVKEERSTPAQVDLEPLPLSLKYAYIR